MGEQVLRKREMHGLWNEETNQWMSKPYYRNTKQLIRGIDSLSRNDVRNLLKNNKENTINKIIMNHCKEKYGDKATRKLYKASKLTYERYKTPLENY